MNQSVYIYIYIYIFPSECLPWQLEVPVRMLNEKSRVNCDSYRESDKFNLVEKFQLE